MRDNIVLTLTGADRVGIVEEVTRILFENGGNVETSRMARLGGDFAMLVLVSMPAENAGPLDQALQSLREKGFKVTTTRTEEGPSSADQGWEPHEIEVTGADHEGIIHQVANYLSGRGISIESMETGVSQAPMSGIRLFAMKATVMVPPGLAKQAWQTALVDLGQELNVDISTSAAKAEA